MFGAWIIFFGTLLVTLRWMVCNGWLPDTSSKLTNDFSQIQLASSKFIGNASFPDYFTVLNQDENTILLGGRNKVYNLSIYDLVERRESRIEWASSEAHAQLCSLKGKSEDDCQNYIRILVPTAAGKLMICGTNSYKPLCRYYSLKGAKYRIDREVEGVGLCPFSPEHNSTSVYTADQLYSATVADFSGTDPLIYRHPLRTELSDLKQLNDPNFVSSIPYGDYIFFFYRETAVEYINCGKIIYSRVARICKEDKGGPHQFRDRWTSFLKARLNCSVPGEYPFYFDEIQSTSDIIDGYYGSNSSQKIIYGTLTTPVNAIGGSAICAYSVRDILDVFEGSFKHQESINANWLPFPREKVPEPRPGQCAQDSRVLPESNINFVKTHSLMEEAVPTLFGRPLLIRVSLHYRFTSITVDAQVQTVDDKAFDVLYIGTDNGKVLKVVNIPSSVTAKAVVISENTVFPNGAAIKQLKMSSPNGKVIVVGKDEVRLVNFHHCGTAHQCSECIALQDPHCAWDKKQDTCVDVSMSTLRSSLIQDILNGDSKTCDSAASKKVSSQTFDEVTIKTIISNDIDDNDIDTLIKTNPEDINCDGDVNTNQITGCAVRQRAVIYTAETLHLVVIVASVVGLLVGFLAGYFVSRRFHPTPHYPDAPFIEQRNHLERLSGNQNGFLTPRANKAVNLEVNVPPNPPPPKKDNLDISKDLNIASDGTLQKIKKTYI